MSRIEKNYELAREQYAELGVDTESALQRVAAEAISIHAWQGDDVAGFEPQTHALPWGAVWQYFCEKNNIPQDWDVINPIREYEKTVLVNR